MRIFGHIILFSVLLAGSGCNSYGRLLKTGDYDKKFSAAKELYNKGDYDKALPFFEELMAVYKGTKDVEKLYYYYPYCHFGLGDYQLAIFYFQNFLDYYPRSDFAEDARYMIAYSYYMMSPVPSLEQSNTEKAMEAFQLFANMNPNSKYIPEVNSLMDELRAKMEEKSLKSAMLYFNMREYRAAATALLNVLNDYPETKEREKIMFHILKSQYLLADNSIKEKKRERYENAVASYIEFISLYPQSKYLKDAEKMYLDIQQKLIKIKADEQI